MPKKNSVPPIPSFKKDFFRYVSNRVAVAGRAMPGCDRGEYRRLSERHYRLYLEISGRLAGEDKGLLGEFDYTSEALAGFDADNAYIPTG